MNAVLNRADELRGRIVSACPACGGTAAERVGGDVPGYRTLVGEKSFDLPTYSIRECPTCGLYFKSATIGHEELADYYSRLDSGGFERGENFPTDRIVRGLLAALPQGARVLDFGCSSGRVHEGLTDRVATYGVEINAAAAEIARNRRITIIPEEKVGASGPFDLILAADVYEHLTQPLETMEMLAASLAPGGRLVIVTGNGDAVPTRDWMGEFWYFRPEGHLHMVSERHVKWLAGRLSLRVESLHACCHYDLPMVERFRQRLQAFAYGQFKRAPRSRLTALLRWIPLLRRAERWPLAPSLTCTADHFVIVLRKE